jgi:hypothetical protein
MVGSRASEGAATYGKQRDKPPRMARTKWVPLRPSANVTRSPLS